MITRLDKAEEILDMLSSGYFVELLNQHSDEYKEGLGDMVERYWREAPRPRTVTVPRSELEDALVEGLAIVKRILQTSGDHEAVAWLEKWKDFKPRSK